MASAFYSEDLTCAICLTIFTNPVNLPCGHSFCRECITHVLSSQLQCPQCRTAVPTEAKSLPTSHILKSLAEKAKQAEKIKKEHGNEKAEVAELCPEHEEKLKLFCVTDQQLACIICRDGEKHEGHKFKPIKEAAASLRQELEKGMENLCEDILATESLANTQREEMTKTKEKSQQLETQIYRQFEEMHQFLRKREDEIKNELKHKEEDAVEKMSKTLNAIETALSESRELQGKVTSVLKITDSDRFLKSWTEGNNMVTAKRSVRPRGNDLRVVIDSLSLGPYESHLQFFMWKEMLQVIQPRAELLSLRNDNTNLNVSEDQRSLFVCPTQSGFPSGSNQLGQGRDGFIQHRLMSRYKHVVRYQEQFNFANLPTTETTTTATESTNQFTSGQHYWEIDVGQRNRWELGAKKHFLRYDGTTYVVCSQNSSTALTFAARPRKIGIYLNCSSKELSFYDADNMRHIHTVRSSSMSMPVSAYFKIDCQNPDHTPLTVCWY